VGSARIGSHRDASVPHPGRSSGYSGHSAPRQDSADSELDVIRRLGLVASGTSASCGGSLSPWTCGCCLLRRKLCPTADMMLILPFRIGVLYGIRYGSVARPTRGPRLITIGGMARVHTRLSRRGADPAVVPHRSVRSIKAVRPSRRLAATGTSPRLCLPPHGHGCRSGFTPRAASGFKMFRLSCGYTVCHALAPTPLSGAPLSHTAVRWTPHPAGGPVSHPACWHYLPRRLYHI
jgi:hypothetical protein